VLKWKLMLTTLPIVAAVTAVKLGLELNGFAGVVEFSDVGVVLTGAVFLTGFLLSGTMSDFKESEKLPGDLATTLETIEELFVLAATQRPSLDVAELRKAVLGLADAILGWLAKQRTTAQVFEAMTAMNGVICRLEKEGAGPYASRAVPQLLMVRRAVSRIDVISRTGFLPPAYALLEVLLAMIIGLLCVAKFKTFIGECILVPFVTLVNVYMIRLIKDIDDPFDYAPDGAKRGAAEIDLFPLTEYRARLAARAESAR
jgi:hypothetical protein